MADTFETAPARSSPGVNSPSRTPSEARGIPAHVAIIMDGNGRWAKERGHGRTFGHRAGVEAVRRTVKAATNLGISYLTLYSFSSENWSRPSEEINDLMGLMKRFILGDLAELHQNNVRIRVIGSRENIDPELLTLIDDAVNLTNENTKLTLVIAFNYGSRAEIAEAAAALAREVGAGTLKPADITAARLEAALATKDIPDPDLLIRTSGEMRLSNFLLWQAAYAEFVFLETYWPDFNQEHLEEAIAIYQARERRFGGLSRSTA